MQLVDSWFAMTGVQTAHGYIRWFYYFSHPCIILQDEDVPIPRPPKQDALDVVAAEQNEEDGYLVLTEKLDHIRDHVYAVMLVVWCIKGLWQGLV